MTLSKLEESEVVNRLSVSMYALASINEATPHAVILQRVRNVHRQMVLVGRILRQGGRLDPNASLGAVEKTSESLSAEV